MRGNSHVQFLGGSSSERMGGYPTAVRGLRARTAQCFACRHKLLADTQKRAVFLGLVAKNHTFGPKPAFIRRIFARLPVLRCLPSPEIFAGSGAP